jgi:hypothetical protein
MLCKCVKPQGDLICMQAAFLKQRRSIYRGQTIQTWPVYLSQLEKVRYTTGHNEAILFISIDNTAIILALAGKTAVIILLVITFVLLPEY